MTRIHQLNELGQSIWFDYIDRRLLRQGGLKDLLDKGITGVTSNPSIFEKAIAGSPDYDDDIRLLTRKGYSAAMIYEALVLSDIREAADLLLPVYERTLGVDGFVSLEVSPEIAHDSDKTYQEAIRLFKTLNRPNVMIKVPATDNGMDAVTRLIASGVNVNITLIFSIRQYAAAAQSYINGLKQLVHHGPTLEGGLSIDRISSVASIFISRTDSALDRFLIETNRKDLVGKTAISVAKSAYARFMNLFSGTDWDLLAAKGARVQRPLWASTSTKNPDYPDTMYVNELIGPHTVNTLPPNTVDAFLDHGWVGETLTADLNQADRRIREITELGIDLNSVLQSLQKQGLDAFSTSFSSLLKRISEKRNAFS